MDEKRILLLEDSRNDAELIQLELLNSLELEFIFKQIDNREDFLAQLENFKPDIILSDYKLPQYDGLSALADLKKIGKEIPFIFVTGTLSEEVAADSIKSGAWDFVVKERLFRLPSVIQNVLQLKKQKDEKKYAEEALKDSEEKYRLLIQQSEDAIFLYYNGNYEIINKKFLQMFGLTEDKIFSTNFNFLDIVADKSMSLIRNRQKQHSERKWISPKYEFTGITTEGKEIEIEASESYIDYKSGYAIQGILRDVTERKQLEEQFRQSQKMEVVGQLAGGVAHDFNNLLTVIVGYSDLIISNPQLDSSLTDQVMQIYKAGERAQALTNQLLTFSRQQIIKKVVLNLNDVIYDLLKMCKRLIGEDISISFKPHKNSLSIQADINQIEQIIVNLIINASDAIHERKDSHYEKQITIATKQITMNPENLNDNAETLAKPYALLTISDTGTGMDETVRNRIFEPFYTTKKQGHGTGLGLSTVYGIIQQNDAIIQVKSKPGQGSTFLIYWPSIKSESTPEKDTKKIQTITPGNETILLVEDDESVLNFTNKALTKIGYNVLPTKSVEEALKIALESDEKIDLLLSDMIMPNLGGEELYEIIHESHPELPVVFVSGYSDSNLLSQNLSKSEINFLQKPFTIAELSKTIRRVLEDNYNKSKVL